MFLQPVKIDTPLVKHEILGECILIHKFVNLNALVVPTLEKDFNVYIIDLRDTDYEI